MHGLSCILFLLMTAVTQIWLAKMQHPLRVRLMGLMAIVTLSQFNGQVFIGPVETFLIMAPEAQLGNWNVQQFVVILSMRVMAGSAFPRDNGRMNVLGR
jgi:hypothetical protein